MLGAGQSGRVTSGAAAACGRRDVFAALGLAAAAVSVLAGCGPIGALAPTSSPVADPANSGDASAPETSPPTSPNSSPGAAGEPTSAPTEGAPTEPPSVDPPSVAPLGGTPPPVFPLPYAVEPALQYGGDGSVEVAASYDFAIACDGPAQLWFDDGDATEASEADGPVVDCSGVTLQLMIGVPGSVAWLWASPEIALIVERRETGAAPFSAGGSTPLRDAIAYRLSGPTTVTVSCASTNGTVVLAGLTASCAGVEYLPFTDMPAAAALDELTLPPDYRGLVSVSQ